MLNVMRTIVIVFAFALCFIVSTNGSFGQFIKLGINEIDVGDLNPGDKVYISLTIDTISPGAQIWGMGLFFNIHTGYLQWDGTLLNPMPGVTYVNPLFPPVILPAGVAANWYLHSNGIDNVFGYLQGDGVSYASLDGQTFPVTILTLKFTYLGGISLGQIIPITWSTETKGDNDLKTGGLTEVYYNDFFEVFPVQNFNNGYLMGGYHIVILNLNTFFEGPYLNNEMTSILNSSGYIPLSQPYNIAPWNYNGDESVALIPNENVVDWVLVELLKRHPVSNGYLFEVKAQKAGFLLSDGQIKGLDGLDDIYFFFGDATDLYVRVNHRNHLPLISSTSLEGGKCMFDYDFTSAASKAIGGEYVQTQLSPSVWGARAADADASKQINNQDKDDIWLNQAGLTGYYSGDLNMNSIVDDEDVLLKWKPNAGNGLTSVNDTIVINK